MTEPAPLGFPEGDAFEAAIMMNVDERASYLAELKADDPTLYGKVTRLLAKSSEIEAARARDLTAGTRLGSYTLVRLLGEGGFGQVWQATQPEMPPVALKVARLFTGRSEELKRRLEVERKALARLRHRGIAGIRGWGLEPVAYFAMDLIDGLPITEYARLHGCTTAQRVDLVIDLCEALEHAHGESVLHRDLKPSNVLVETEGDRPVVKVIDFGIARLLDAAGDEQPTLTEAGEIRGTPGYMSPEQATGGGSLGVWTDVFSAGRILFELLTGEPAIPRDATNPEVLRALEQDEPPSPRERLAGSAHSGPSIPTDLDTITKTAMAKDPSKRYGSALELRTDLQAWRAGEPISARRPRLSERLLRAARRHRAVLIPSAILLVSLLAVLAALERGRQRAKGEQERQERTTAALASHLSGLDVASLAQSLRSETVGQLMRNLRVESEGELPTSVQAIDFTSLARSYFDVSYLEGAEAAFRSELGRDPLVLAELLSTLAGARLSLRLTESGTRVAKEAFEILTEELGPLDPKTLSVHAQFVRGLVQAKDSRPAVEQAEALVERSSEARGEFAKETLLARLSLCRALSYSDRREEVEARSIALCQDIEDHFDVVPGDLAAAWTDLAERQFNATEFGDAIATLRRAKEIGSRGEVDELRAAQIDVSLGRALAAPVQLGDLSGLEEAKALMIPASKLVLAQRGDEHRDGLGVLNSLTILARATGDTELMLETARRSYEGFARANGSRDPVTVMLQANTVMAMIEAEQYDEADALAVETLAANALLAAPMPHVEAAVVGERGRLRGSQKDFQGGEPFLLDCYAKYEALLGAEHPQAQQIARLLSNFYAQWHDAEPTLGRDKDAAKWKH